MKAAILYTLLIVSEAGNVQHVDGFTTLTACREAESVAVSGKTLAEVKEAQQAEKEAREKADAAWRKDHPPRPWLTPDNTCVGYIFSTAGVCHLTDDGMVEDDRSARLGAIWRYVNPTDVKYSKCVVIPADAK